MQRAATDALRARRWKARQAISDGVVEFRRRLNALIVDDVTWTLYKLVGPIMNSTTLHYIQGI